MMARTWMLLMLAALAGCATRPAADAVPAGETPAQVRERLGAPGAERKLAGGETAWFYMTGPSGFHTWRVVFGGGGTVTEYAQVLTMANFVWLREGANREAALDRLGPPMQRMGFSRTATDTWTYRWRDGTFEMIADAVFDAASGEVKYVGIFRDPAYASTPSGFR